MPSPEISPPQDYCAQRTAMMPKRRRTRAQDRATRITTERTHNRQARGTPEPTDHGGATTRADAEPPPG
jgi:hypothetical protein